MENILSFKGNKFYSCDEQKAGNFKSELDTSNFSSSNRTKKNLDAKAQYYKEVKSIELMTEEIEKELLTKINFYKNDRTKYDMEYNFVLDKLFNANAGLVLDIVKHFYTSDRSVETTDLIKEGNQGLMKAIEKYNINSGCRLSTYAVPLIRQAIGDYIRYNCGQVKLPSNIVKDMAKINKKIEELYNKNGVEPTYDEVAYELNMTTKHVNKVLNYKYYYDYLDEAVAGEEDITLGDKICDTKTLNPEDYLIACENRSELENSINELNDTEKEIFMKRNGINEEPKTLEEIAKEKGISIGKVYTIEKNANEKIKNILIEHEINSCSY